MTTHRRIAMAGIAITGTMILSGCGSDASSLAASEKTAPSVSTAAGYEGWWNASPLDGDTSDLPHETVAVLTETGEIVDASIRDALGQAQAVDPDDVEYTVVQDPLWPQDSVVIIDVETDKVIESFAVDPQGTPLR